MPPIPIPVSVQTFFPYPEKAEAYLPYMKISMIISSGPHSGCQILNLPNNNHLKGCLRLYYHDDKKPVERQVTKSKGSTLGSGERCQALDE